MSMSASGISASGSSGENCRQFPTFAFHHHHGLGVACVGEAVPEGIEVLIEATRSPTRTALWRTSFARLGAGVQKAWEATHHAETALRSASDAAALVRRCGDLEIEGANLTHQIDELTTALAGAQAEIQNLRSREAAANAREAVAKAFTEDLAAQLSDRTERAARELAETGRSLERSRRHVERLARELEKQRRRRRKRKRSLARRLSRPLRAVLELVRKPFKQKKIFLAPKTVDQPKGNRDRIETNTGSEQYLALSDDAMLVKNSGLFDAEWYVAKYPDPPVTTQDALRHYLEHGAAQGRDPNPNFSGAWYTKSYPDAARSGLVRFFII